MSKFGNADLKGRTQGAALHTKEADSACRSLASVLHALRDSLKERPILIDAWRA